ncbi:MAG: GNAT family N-acetyltransferase [Armatimonadota bacterium]
MNRVVLREATIQDAALVYRVTRSAFVEYAGDVPPPSALFETLEEVRDDFARGCGAVLATLVESDGGDARPVGCVRYRLGKGGVHFFRLAVAPSARRRGIARALIGRVEEIGRSRGCVRATCHVRTGVARNVAMYEGMGYALAGEDMQIRGGFVIRVGVMEKRWISGGDTAHGSEAK